MFKILLAEDDDNLRKLTKKNLELKGYYVSACNDGEAALAEFSKEHYDVLVTDIMMPNMDGDTLVSNVKKIRRDMPVIMLTALDTISDKKKSFGNGADDYMCKPIDFDELDLRISVLLRRYDVVNSQIVRHNETTLDYGRKTMTVNGAVVELTKKEFMLIYILMSMPGKIYSRAQLLDEIWGYDSDSLERTVDVHITKIREKLQGSGVEIMTVRGLGYKAELK